MPGDVVEMPRQASRLGRKRLIFAENVLYWVHYKLNPSAACMAPMGSRENIEQGRGSSARRLCHRKRVKRVLQEQPPKKPPRAAAVQPKAVPGLLSGLPGPPPRPRLRNPQKTKEAQCQTRLQKLRRK